jgi:hypothetical protein
MLLAAAERRLANTIALFDGLASMDFYGLSATASYRLYSFWEAGSGSNAVWRHDRVLERGDCENWRSLARGSVVQQAVKAAFVGGFFFDPGGGHHGDSRIECFGSDAAGCARFGEGLGLVAYRPRAGSVLVAAGRTDDQGEAPVAGELLHAPAERF